MGLANRLVAGGETLTPHPGGSAALRLRIEPKSRCDDPLVVLALLALAASGRRRRDKV